MSEPIPNPKPKRKKKPYTMRFTSNGSTIPRRQPQTPRPILEDFLKAISPIDVADIPEHLKFWHFPQTNIVDVADEDED